jgi:hypothetical protein
MYWTLNLAAVKIRSGLHSAGIGKEDSHGLPHPCTGLGGPALDIDRGEVGSCPACFRTGEDKIMAYVYSLCKNFAVQ